MLRRRPLWMSVFLLLCAACGSRNAPPPHTVDEPGPTVYDAATAPEQTGWKPVDVDSLDAEWKSLLETCLVEKRKDGQNIDAYQLVETKTVGDTRYLYFTPKPSPNGLISSDHFGCRFDADRNVHILYEG